MKRLQRVMKLWLCTFIATMSSLVFADSFSRAVLALNEDIKQHPEWNFHSLLVSKNGQLILEEYYTGSDQKWGQDLGAISFNRETLHDLRSVTKSVVSTLIGIAISTGDIKSVDQPLSDFFPELKFTDKKRLITLRHALTMTTGLAWDEMSTSYADHNNDSSRIVKVKDPAAFVLERPVVSTPGEVFNYSGGSTELLAEVLQRATKKPLKKYFEEKLWLPLGGQINGYVWGGRENDLPSADSGLRVRPIDLMKFANLFENQGKYNGKQIVPVAWIAEATKNQIKALPDNFAARFVGYGYQWWLPKIKGAENAKVFAALGNGGQIIMTFPEQKIIFVTTSGRYNLVPNPLFGALLENHIIPTLTRK